MYWKPRIWIKGQSCWETKVGFMMVCLFFDPCLSIICCPLAQSDCHAQPCFSPPRPSRVQPSHPHLWHEYAIWINKKTTFEPVCPHSGPVVFLSVNTFGCRYTTETPTRTPSCRSQPSRAFVKAQSAPSLQSFSGKGLSTRS